MSTQANKATVYRIPAELYNQGNLAVVDEVFADDMVESLVDSINDQLEAERGSRDALVSLASLAAKGIGTGGSGPDGGSVTVPVTITINGGSSSKDDTVAIVKREIADFDRKLGEAFRQAGSRGIPASSQLAGARHQ